MMIRVLFLLMLLCNWPIQADDIRLRVVTELSPPHQVIVQGEVAGLSTELVRAILAEADISAAIEIYPWARAFHIAHKEPNVLIYNMARTAEREHAFQWIGTVAAYQLGFVRLSHRSDIQLQSVNAARQYTIAVQRDDLSANYLIEQGFVVGKQLILAADINESWQLLLHGKVDLVIDDQVALSSMVEQFNISPAYVQFVYAIPALQQQTWLAASLATPAQLVSRLQQAHGKIALTEHYHQVMSSSYRQ